MDNELYKPLTPEELRYFTLQPWPAQPVNKSEPVPSEPPVSQESLGSALEVLFGLLTEQTRQLQGLSQSLDRLILAMAEDQGDESGGFTSLDQS